MARERLLKPQSGQALIMTLAVLAFLLPLGAFAILQARVDLLLQRHARIETELFYAADSGLEHALAEVESHHSFERLLTGPDGEPGTEDDESFPFLHAPPGFFPRPPLLYEVSVARRDAQSLDVIADGRGPARARQTVAASVVRSSRAFVAGAMASAAADVILTLGEGMQVKGTDRSGQDPPVFGLAVPTDEDAGRISATLDPISAQQVIGSGGTPSIGASSVPSVEAWEESIASDPRTRWITDDDNGPLGDGIFASHGSLDSNLEGSGLLFVGGNLRVASSLSFNGVLIVLGDVTLEPGSEVQVRGALLQGRFGQRLDLLGAGEIAYDAAAVAEIDREIPGLLPHRAVIAGWRQIF